MPRFSAEQGTPYFPTERFQASKVDQAAGFVEAYFADRRDATTTAVLHSMITRAKVEISREVATRNIEELGVLRKLDEYPVISGKPIYTLKDREVALASERIRLRQINRLIARRDRVLAHYMERNPRYKSAWESAARVVNTYRWAEKVYMAQPTGFNIPRHNLYTAVGTWELLSRIAEERNPKRK